MTKHEFFTRRVEFGPAKKSSDDDLLRCHTRYLVDWIMKNEFTPERIETGDIVDDKITSAVWVA